MKSASVSRMRLGLTGVLLVALSRAVCAVPCPNGGAVLNVVVYNPTSSPAGVTISGNVVTGSLTCTSGSATYSRSVVLNPGTNTINPPFTGLDTGVWVHKITVSAGSNQYVQYQKGTVLEATNTSNNPYSVANWTYFPTSVTVTTTGDAQGGTCGTNCTFRQALNTANSWNTSSSNPGLIRFSVSPGAMSNTNALSLSHSYVTIDGTDSNGNPWVVGEAQGTQDTFPTVVDLANTTQISLSGSNDTIEGLAILNTSSGTPNYSLIKGNSDSYTTIQNVRLDGGAASVGSNCGTLKNLVDSLGSAATVSNVEGRSACGNGVYMPYSPPAVTKSWFHNNLAANLTVASSTSLTRNFVELGGIRSDNYLVNASAVGILGAGGSSIVTSRNVVRDNTESGLDLAAVAGQSSVLSLSDDYVCGNGSHGIALSANGGAATGTGLGLAYNGGNGIAIGNGFGGPTLTFDGNSAFTANGSPGFADYSSGGNVTATNNQWRGVTTGCHSSWDVYDPSGLVTCDPVQDQINVIIQLGNPLDQTVPKVVPSNVMYAAQTIQVQGTGFNAIDGNPVAGTTCSTSYGTTSSNCCRNTAKANGCSSSTPPDGLSDHSNCTSLKDRAGTWHALSVSSVTPTTITTQIPSLLACIGNDGEQVRVSKLKGNGQPTIGTGDYCTNLAPK